jgi:acyl-coenzyme A synthetase/AMP-(fatty) acid ligase
MVVHTLKTLAAPVEGVGNPNAAQNWATFYDIRRYGGLQIFMRAVVGGGSLALRDSAEASDEFLMRVSAENVTHISGTPSHWRLALLNPGVRHIDPSYVRMSGEIADRATLEALRTQFPRARIVHAFASTEAGVCFEVEDGGPGFPASFIHEGRNGVSMKMVDGSLRVRSDCASLRYLGAHAPPLSDDEGFVDTGDIIEIRGDRCFFVGRRGGIINIGGDKVNPEEVEEVINKHAGVRMSLVKGRKNPLVGELIAADVVLRDGVQEGPAIKQEIITACAAELASFKVPALIRFVPSLSFTPSGKLMR